jgi:hypothetical protein
MKTIVRLTICCLAACASSSPPLPTMLGAGDGEPKMQAALWSLEQAKTEAEAPGSDDGGHLERALGRIQQAIDAVNAGLQYAATHPTEIGGAGGAAAPASVDEQVPGAERQPHMSRALVALHEARRQLREAKDDKGGYRVHALILTQDAIGELREGITFANRP